MQSYPLANIDLAALKHNFARVKQLAPDSCIMSVIKANAYGHGYVQVAKALMDTDAFAVARLSEGVLLRDAGIDHPIVLLEGVISAEELQTASEYSLSIVFHNLTQIEWLVAAQLKEPLKFSWLMVETGMHRLGLPIEHVNNALDALTQSSNILGDVGLMSHFANADVVNEARNQSQLDKLSLCAKKDTPISMANSGAILSFPDSHGDWVRPGVMLYGASPFDDQLASDLDLQPVMQLSSKLIAIQQLEAGDQVGYGGDWHASKAIRIGVVSIGYGDGYSRQLSNIGQVAINNKMATVLGRISMDMITIDLSTVDNAAIGDEVILWGGAAVAVEDVAQQANTIPYELLCQVSERVKRVYQNG